MSTYLIPKLEDFITDTNGGGWAYTTSLPTGIHVPTTTSTTTTTSTCATTSSCNPYTNNVWFNDPWGMGEQGVIEVADIKIKGLGSIKQLLENQKFLALPSELDLENPTIKDGVVGWYNAIENLKKSHEQLIMLAKLIHEE
jgi:hypothetical protein